MLSATIAAAVTVASILPCMALMQGRDWLYKGCWCVQHDVVCVKEAFIGINGGHDHGGKLMLMHSHAWHCQFPAVMGITCPHTSTPDTQPCPIIMSDTFVVACKQLGTADLSTSFTGWITGA